MIHGQQRGQGKEAAGGCQSAPRSQKLSTTWIKTQSASRGPKQVSSVKLHVSIGKYWVSLYVLVCMVVCIVERIGMYWHGMYYGMYWYVLFLVCITYIGKYWYVFRGHMCKYSYVLVSIGMYRKMVCIVHIGMYWYILVYIDLYWPVLDVFICIGMYGMYWSVFVGIGK